MEDEYENENEGLEEEKCFVEEINEVSARRENQRLLEEYCRQMAYPPRPAKPASKRTEQLATAKRRTLMHTYQHFGQYLSPPQRKARLQRINKDFTAITTQQFEQIVKLKRAKEKKQKELQLRKQDLYYDMMQKLETQCRHQYLNVILKKFADFLAKLATTMRIPPQLVDPFAQMQRGIFWYILMAMGLQPTSQAAAYYNTVEATQYEVAHKLAHALLSLIMKALDEAANKTSEDIQEEPLENDWDEYIKNRIQCAAAKKCVQEENMKKKAEAAKLSKIISKCHNFDMCYEHL